MLLLTGCSGLSEFDKRHQASAGFVLQGDSYHSSGVFNKAIEYYKNALALRACTINVYTRLGEVSLGLADEEQALYYFRYAEKYYPLEFKAYFLSGKIILRRNLPSGRKYLRKALGLVQGELRENIESRISEALEEAGTNFQETDVGVLSESIADYARRKSAKAAFSRSLESPKYIREKALVRAARILEKEGLLPEAAELIDYAWKDSGHSHLLIAAGNLFFRQQQYGRAAVFYRLYSEQELSKGYGFFNMGVLYLKNGLEARSREMFGKAGEAFREEAEKVRRDFQEGKHIIPLEAE